MPIDLTGTVQAPLAVQAILAHRARSGAPTAPPPHPVRPRLDRAPVAAPDGPGQQAIEVLTLAFAPLMRALPGVRLGRVRAAAFRPPASRGEGAEGAALVRLCASRHFPV